jgi:signal transduction histidine kinase
VRTEPPTSLEGQNLELRSQLSNLHGLLVLAMLMTESADEGQILRLATSSVGHLAGCRPEGVYLTGQGWRWTAESWRQETARRAVERQLAGFGPLGGTVEVPGRPWGCAYPLRSLAGGVGFVIVSAEGAPTQAEQFLLRVLAQQAGMALVNARLHAQEHATAEGLADEQAALRRVATLVAHAPPPLAVFAAVAEEVGRLLAADLTVLARYEADDTVTVVGSWSRLGDAFAVGTRTPLGGHNTTTLVFQTGRPARIDHFAADDASAVTAIARSFGVGSAVGAPITVEGRLWGAMQVAWSREAGLPADTEERLAAFTELVATAIANAEAREELTASRARIAATADQTRRRIERDLHDGAQQRLVSLALQLRAAQAAVPPELDELGAELDRAAAGLDGALEELRELARGIHPAILAEGGLAPALKTLARRSAVPVELHLGTPARLPERVEVAVYYVVAEALTNAAKHAGASVVRVDVDVDDGPVRLAIRDDGVGGADPARGSGLVGLKDRVEATGGTLCVDSRPGQGTSLLVELPIDAGQPPDST